MKRCINLDWLEVHCIEFRENEQLDANYFRQFYVVKERAYGTPQYQEMFTLYIYEKPFLEIRRNPYSLKKNGGIFDDGSCHIRLCNETCYTEHPIDDLRRFLLRFKYTYKNITRIDICVDFNHFDKGDNPQKFLNDYLKLKYRKINQCNIASYGKDKWDTMDWNSVHWGTPNSPVSTKFYNKSLELKEKKDKIYIKQAWIDAGLNPENVWRVEFSINSKIRDYVHTESGEMFKHTLSCYDTKEKLIYVFHSLVEKYFHFKYTELTADGSPKRKSRCKDKLLFYYHKDETALKPLQHDYCPNPDKIDKILIKRLIEISKRQDIEPTVKIAARTMILYYRYHRKLPLWAKDFESAYDLVLTHPR